MTAVLARRSNFQGRATDINPSLVRLWSRGQTLVLAPPPFLRTPLINSSAGRPLSEPSEWPPPASRSDVCRCFSESMGSRALCIF
ncbi:hypothetical protein GUJ93_ZPchr0007g5237 [Zizania palustris]|uniref:Uncharacterized protein n=1 Tax=Zizania palustris TaxID=103762 RepID=A0A8J5TG27_ZIZPA|nr:hypothetical protein GUJ93_ZPchr0007g5237 [Zizania palustris]